MNEEKVCRICLSNTLNLFDDDLIQKIIKQSELESANKKDQKDSSITDDLNNEKNEDNDNEQHHCDCIKNVENENGECCSHSCNTKSEQETEKIWRRIKSIDKDIIKKCIYDYYYEESKNDLFSFIENTYNSMIRFFIYIVLIPKWIYWMTRNLFFIDIWKNPFLYYNKSCFKHNSEDINGTYLSEMSYLKRRAALKEKNPITLNAEPLSNEKIYDDDTFKPKLEIGGEDNDDECGDNNSYNNETVIEQDNKEDEKSVSGNNDSNSNSSEMLNNNSNMKNNKNNYEENNSFNRLLRNSVMRTSSSLSSLNIAERTIKKANSLELPLRKTSSGSFFHPFSDNNKSSLGMEKERNILRSSYMSLDEFFRNLDSSDNPHNEASYQKIFFNQKQRLKHSLYNTISSFEKKIIDQPLYYKLYCKCIYPLKIKLENTNKYCHYKKNKLTFSLNVQKNLQKSWWDNQNKIKNYQKRYFFLNRIPEDVNYYIDKLISPCKCKGSQKYVHSYCLDEWRMRTSLEIGQQENCILCRQNYRKKDNNKWYTKLQKKEVQNTILLLTIAILVLIGGFIMKYILDTTYKYLDIVVEYEEYPEHNNSSLWNIDIYEDSNPSQDNCFIQPPENLILYPDENFIYNIEETIEDTPDMVLHEFLFSKNFLQGIRIISNITYHIMAGMFFWGSVINTIILYDSIEMVVKHHFNRGLRFKPLLLITIIYFWWIYCSAAFEDLIGVNEYSIAQRFETILLLKNGWVPESVEYLLFIAKWALRIVTMELGIYFNGICFLRELLTFNYSACLNKDQILNFEKEQENMLPNSP